MYATKLMNAPQNKLKKAIINEYFCLFVYKAQDGEFLH